MNPNKTRLILPSSVDRDQGLSNVRATPQNPPKVNIPPQMLDEVRTFVPEAKELGEAVKVLMDKGPAAQVAMLADESIRRLIEIHITALLPHISAGVASTDRQQLAAFMRQILTQRLNQAQVTGESIHTQTYEMAISDLLHLSAKIPAPVLPVKIAIPDLDVPESNPEIPNSGGP